MRIHKDSLRSLIQFCVLSCAILVASGISDSITAAPKKNRLIARMLRGDYHAAKILKSFSGTCDAEQVNPFFTDAITITTKRNTVNLHGRATMSSDISRRGKYRGQVVKFRAGTDDSVVEALRGRFKYNRKTNRVNFHGTYSYESQNDAKEPCLLTYQVDLLPIS
ncbi:MAG: hypothetical protein KDD62_02910 [Bdellovibrionales bacterium]|nr:hypothetical protein [Bdellovibrionales bacterium]